ncbi:MAG TPA: YdcF family protein [Bacteroidia bacterium]|nr:YdcF family protein [Bacteroidia bacterium]
MFFLLSKIFEFVLLPLTWIIVLLGVGLYKNANGRRMILAAFLMLLFFTNPYFINVALHSWEVQGRKVSSIDLPYDVVIVLGGSMRYYNGELNRPVYSSSVDRMLQAITLYKQHKVKKILLSGGSGRVLFPDERESAILAGILDDAGIPRSDIILENNSRNTWQNAVESAKLLKSGTYGNRFLLLTSAFHMRRSLACFSKAGLKCDPWSVDQRSGQGTFSPDRIILPEAAAMGLWDILFHEWFGVIFYKIAGYN